MTLVAQSTRLLPREEPGAGEAMLDAFESEGIRVLLSACLAGVDQTGGRPMALVVQGGANVRISCDRVLLALGRRARTQNLGVSELGLKTDSAGNLAVDEWMRTSEPLILAAGDVATSEKLTHVAGHMGWLAAFNALFGDVLPVRFDRSAIPRCVFIAPEVSRVGPTLSEASAAGIKLEVTRLSFDELDRALIDKQTSGFVQVLTRAGTDRIIGATVVGDRAGDLITLFTLAVRHRIGLRKLMPTMAAYPGWADAARAAGAIWQKDRLPGWLPGFLDDWHRWLRR